MSDVTMIGLGNMGSALARALLQGGFQVTVWNRSPEKASLLALQGAISTPDIGKALAASPVVLVCVTNYAASDAILSQAASALAGKILVQLSTGTPGMARRAEAWAMAHGAQYLEAKITGSPASIGTPDAHILLSGSAAAYHTTEPLLRALAANLDYKGAPIGLASAWDLVMIMHYYGMFLSLFHSVQICQAEAIPLEQYQALLGEQNQGYEKWLVENIRTGNYQDTTAPLDLWLGGIQRIREHARECGINAAFPEFIAQLFQQAADAGYSREEVSAVYKVLKKGN
jgi:3-hydroxyisobutyrate dehydrogenase-like beta-hydroxyacid dehydrogenase